MKGRKFTGVIPAFVTPFLSDNKTINESSTRKLLNLHIDQGASGFYILGGTGEGIVMDPHERKVMCEIVIDEVAGRVPVINHIAAMNVNDAVDLAKHAESTGADAIASIPPSFFAYSEKDIYNYYKRLADSVNIPLIIYYHPAAQRDMSAKLIAKIFEIDNVTGVKWSSNNFYELMKLRDMTHGEMNVINGPDELFVAGLTSGADAGIGSTYNVMLPQYIKIYNSFKAGDIDTARATQYQVNRVIDRMFKYGVIPAVKYAVSLMGIDVGTASFPMNQMPDSDKAAFEADLKELGWPFEL